MIIAVVFSSDIVRQYLGAEHDQYAISFSCSYNFLRDHYEVGKSRCAQEKYIAVQINITKPITVVNQTSDRKIIQYVYVSNALIINNKIQSIVRQNLVHKT